MSSQTSTPPKGGEIPIGIIGDPALRIGQFRTPRADEVDEMGELLPHVAEEQRDLRARLAGKKV